jgi:hypothetical protein
MDHRSSGRGHSGLAPGHKNRIIRCNLHLTRHLSAPQAQAQAKSGKQGLAGIICRKNLQHPKAQLFREKGNVARQVLCPENSFGPDILHLHPFVRIQACLSRICNPKRISGVNLSFAFPPQTRATKRLPWPYT